MKNNKFVLPILIIFLLFFLPLSIYGIYSNKNSILSIDNPNHEHNWVCTGISTTGSHYMCSICGITKTVLI